MKDCVLKRNSGVRISLDWFLCPNVGQGFVFLVL